jgi:integral membrane protein
MREYDQLNSIFTDGEAWFLFKTAAYLETLGWILLVTGIAFKILELPGYLYVLPIGGSLHGLFIVIYTLIVFFTHRSMKWGVVRFVIAELASLAPFLALAFELWVARQRRLQR